MKKINRTSRATKNTDNSNINVEKYKWCTSCNNDTGTWEFHWKYSHEKWKEKQGKKTSARFSNPETV